MLSSLAPGLEAANWLRHSLWCFHTFTLPPPVSQLKAANVAVNTWNQLIHHMIASVAGGALVPGCVCWGSGDRQSGYETDTTLMTTPSHDLLFSSSSHQPVLWRGHRPHVPHAGVCPPGVWVSTTTTTSHLWPLTSMFTARLADARLDSPTVAVQLDRWYFQSEVVLIHLKRLQSELGSAGLSTEEPIRGLFVVTK